MIFINRTIFSFLHWLLINARVFVFCGVLCLGLTALAQSNAERFGQNRVQYKDFTFQYYDSDNFTTYYYQGGQDIGKYVIKTAEDVTDEISTLFDFKYKRKIDIIVYNNINELNQTNIGIYEQNQNPGGTTNIPDNKIFIYFNGDHRHLDKQLREGIAKIYIDKMSVGGNFAEVIQNAVLLNLPDWYKKGLVQYIGEPWNSDMENKLRDGIVSGRYKRLTKLQPEEAIFVGHSIWHYIEEKHGKAALSNVVYLTRMNRSVENGFLFVLGTGLEQTLQDWYTYFYTRFANERKQTQTFQAANKLNIKFKKNKNYYQTCASSDGKYVALAQNDIGRYKVILWDVEKQKRSIIFKGGYRTNTQFTDESIPLLAWDPSGRKLAIISDKRSEIFLRLYEPSTKKMEKNPMRKFQKVVNFSFVDSKQLVLSAIQNGQTDIFLYTIASTTTRKLTDDYFDDLHPVYINADSLRGIMFSSNRTDDTLRPGRYENQSFNKTHDLFFYDLNSNGNTLYRITNTPLANETYPQNFSEAEYSFLSDANGIRNRYVGQFESVFDHHEMLYRYLNKETDEIDSLILPENLPFDSVMDRKTVDVLGFELTSVYKIGGVTRQWSNYNTNINEQTVLRNKAKALDLVIQKNRPVLYLNSLSDNTNSNFITTDYVTKLKQRVIPIEKKPVAPIVIAKEKAEPQRDTTAQAIGNRPFDFQSEFDNGIKLFDWDSASASKLENAQEGYQFRFSRVRPYFVKFAIDNVVAQIDNNIIVNRYQPFDSNVPQFNNNPVSFMLKFGITDLLENHKVYGGMRLPFSGLNSTNEYFLTYENLKKRLDKKFTFYRRSIGDRAFDRLPFDGTVLPSGYFVDYSIKTNYAEVELKYPIDVLNSFRFTFSFRNDLIVYKSRDNFSLNLPRTSNNWLFTRAEYVFDNCMEVMTNIRYGTRFKVFAEVHKEFPTKNKVLFDRVDFPVVQFNDNFMTVFGFDLRHYQKVYKQIIWANRIAGGASFGTSKLMTYLGGLDNWITGPNVDKFDRTTPINRNNGYAFQTLATPLRGFKQNARNGDKYLVINSELRVPVFAALLKSPIRSELIRNLQLVGFLDIGTAWEGLTPFSNSNPLFNEEYPNSTNNPSVIVKVKRYKNPVIMGFGPGVRTTFLGYFLRFDAAWSYDTGVLSQKPLYYFTFGLDF